MTVAIRVFVRSSVLVVHLLVGLSLAILVGIEGGRRISRERLGGWWHRRLLRILNIHLKVSGEPSSGPRALVCNHISWLDIHILGACEPTRFVSKAEVRNWPIAGWLANAAGTFYLKRGAGGTRDLISAVSRQLALGPVAFFPEGTTTKGDRVLRFQPRLFAAAIEAGVPIQPIAIRFGRAASGENIAPFIGEMTLTAHLRRLIREPVLDAELIYCKPISSQCSDRGTLAQATQESISTVLGLGQHPAKRTSTPRSLAA